jgi:hypothetical protein
MRMLIVSFQELAKPLKPLRIAGPLRNRAHEQLHRPLLASNDPLQPQRPP